jgi:hypothetical protein
MRLLGNPVLHIDRFLKRPAFLFGTLLLFLSHVAPLPAQVYSYLGGLPSGARQDLMTQRSVSRTHTNVRDVELAPDFPGVRDAIRNLRSVGANIVSERLILVDGPVSDAGLTTVFNAVLGVSGLSHIKYYNPEKDAHHDLFRESFRVADDKNLDRLPDIQVDTIPEYVAIPVLQDLPPFGDVLQTYRYESVSHSGVDGFHFSSENEWDIRYRRIRVVKPEEMITYAWVIRGDDYLLVYGIGAAKVFTGFGLFRDRIENSFTSRTDGLFDWLSENYLKQL